MANGAIALSDDLSTLRSAVPAYLEPLRLRRVRQAYLSAVCDHLAAGVDPQLCRRNARGVCRRRAGPACCPSFWRQVHMGFSCRLGGCCLALASIGQMVRRKTAKAPAHSQIARCASSMVRISGTREEKMVEA